MVEDKTENLDRQSHTPVVSLKSQHTASPPDSSWAQIWQLPMLLLGVVLLVVGVFLAMPPAEGNNFVEALDSVEQYMKANNLDAAENQLQTIQDYIHRGTKTDQIRQLLLWTDLIDMQQIQHGWDKPEKHQRIVDYYGQVDEFEYEFDQNTVHLQRWAKSLVALRQDQAALQILDRLRREPARHRYTILRRIIERYRRTRPRVSPNVLSSLLTRFLDELRGETDHPTKRKQELWAVSLQANILLEVDDAERAIDYLNPRKAAMASRGGNDDLAPLMVLQAQAYQRLGRHEQAEREYRLAHVKLTNDKTNSIHGAILVGLAQIALALHNDVETALRYFSATVKNFPNTAVALDALVGQADCEARQNKHGLAREHFAQAIEQLQDNPFRPVQKVTMLLDTVLSHYHRHFDSTNYEQALDYLNVLLSLYEDELPANLLASLALSHDKLAQIRANEAKVTADAQDPTTRPAPLQAHRMTNRQTTVHFGKAF